MKIYQKISLLLLTGVAISVCSCQKYLEKTPKADISEAQVFTSFNTYQGFVETMYDDMVEWIHLSNRFSEFEWGDDVIPTRKQGFIEGDYFFVIADGNSPYYNSVATRGSGSWSVTANGVRKQAIWQNSWFGIRAANIALAHIGDLADGTDEQKQLLQGQAYFFRAYFHWEMMRAWGKIPYIDKAFEPSEVMNVPQLGLYETAEKILADFQKAADLLPDDWDNTVTGKVTLNNNVGRATKGMAYSMMSECLLYCASPLFNGVATGSYTYNTEYAKKAANASWQVIKLANSGVYTLQPWATYADMFFRKDNTVPRSKEIIFTAPSRGDARYFSSSFTGSIIGTDNFYDSPTQNFVEMFESSNGLPIDDPAANYSATDPWNNRDPRFRYNIRIDNDRQVTNRNDDLAFTQFYVGGRERTATMTTTGFGFRKYWDATINKYDNGWNKYYYEIPRMRLAEIYLIYAEAANEAYNGPSGKDPQATLSAVEAVNIVRARANMPVVNSKFLGSKEAFRDRIWNERAVELTFESKRWYDIRRWHVAHLPKYRELYGLEFDKAHTFFRKTLITTIDFSEKHYWLPFPISQISLYPEWKQNPGW